MRPTLEFTHFLPTFSPATHMEDVPLAKLQLPQVVINALAKLGFENVAQIKEFTDKPTNEPWELAGIKQKRQDAIRDAVNNLVNTLNQHACTNPAETTAHIIGHALAVARKRGRGQETYLDYAIGEFDGKPAIRLRWNGGLSASGMTRRCRNDDPHFHAAPLSQAGIPKNAISECLP